MEKLDKKVKFELPPSKQERDTSDQLIVRNFVKNELLDDDILTQDQSVPNQLHVHGLADGALPQQAVGRGCQGSGLRAG